MMQLLPNISFAITDSFTPSVIHYFSYPLVKEDVVKEANRSIEGDGVIVSGGSRSVTKKRGKKGKKKAEAEEGQ
jgi:hypothetical protein